MDSINDNLDEVNDGNNSEPSNGGGPKRKTKGSILIQRVEVLIIAVFFLSFLLWATSRCSRTQREIALEDQEQKVRDSIEAALNEELAKPIKEEEKEEPEPPEVVIQQAAYTPLYVTLENLNLRDKPSLNGKIQARLKLFDKVEFLNEVTDFKQEYTLGDLKTNEPWIRVKTEKGVEGWVYGAGVNYYKTKLQTKLPKNNTSN